MRLLEMSISGAVFITAAALIRTVLINHLPKKTFFVLWWMVIFCLLVPFRIPSKISLYSWMPPVSGLAQEEQDQILLYEKLVQGLNHDGFFHNDESNKGIDGYGLKSGWFNADWLNKGGIKEGGVSESGMKKSGMKESGMKESGINEFWINEFRMSGPALNKNEMSETALNKAGISESAFNKDGMCKYTWVNSRFYQNSLKPEEFDRESLVPKAFNRDVLNCHNQSVVNKYGQNPDILNHRQSGQNTSIFTIIELYLIKAVSDQFGENGIYMLKIVWAAGVGMFLLFFTLVYVKMRFDFSTSILVKNDYCFQFLKRQSVKRKIQVRQSGLIKAPLTYGVWRPVILMPENTDWNDTEQLEYIFMHEYIHIKRFDQITKLMLMTALAVHWINPFVWIMYLLCSRDLELSCDEAVVHAFGESVRSNYAHILINMEEQKTKLRPLCNSFSKNVMEERIVAIMKMKKRTVFKTAAAALLVCSVSGIFATSAAAEVQEGAGSRLEMQTSLNSNMLKNRGEETGGTQSSDQGTGSKAMPDQGAGRKAMPDQEAGLVRTESGGRTTGTSRAGRKSLTGNEAAEDGSTTAGSSMSAEDKSEKENGVKDHNAAEKNAVKIINTSLNLSNEQAQVISDAVCKHMETKYKGNYVFSNYSIQFFNETFNETVNGDVMSLDIDVSTNMMLIANPKKSSFARGMREAVREIKGAKKKKAARKIYKEWLKDEMSYYMKPDPYTTGFSYHVQIPVSSLKNEADCFEYELFYRSNIDGEILGSFADEPAFKGYSKKDGKSYIKENL